MGNFLLLLLYMGYTIRKLFQLYISFSCGFRAIRAPLYVFWSSKFCQQTRSLSQLQDLMWDTRGQEIQWLTYRHSEAFLIMSSDFRLPMCQDFWSISFKIKRTLFYNTVDMGLGSEPHSLFLVLQIVETGILQYSLSNQYEHIKVIITAGCMVCSLLSALSGWWH
jgi:hypothetical protein